MQSWRLDFKPTIIVGEPWGDDVERPDCPVKPHKCCLVGGRCRKFMYQNLAIHIYIYTMYIYIYTMYIYIYGDDSI